MISGTVAIAFGVFGALFCAGYVILQAVNEYKTAVDLRLLDVKGGSGSRKGSGRSRTNDSSIHMRPWWLTFNRLVPRDDADRRRHQVRLVMAGLYSPSAITALFAAKIILMVVPPLVGALAALCGAVTLFHGLFYGCVGGMFGMILPSFWLDHRIKRRHRILRGSLPDMLDVMTVCLEGGLSVPSTIQRVGDELQFAHPMLAGELSIVQRETELGIPIETALRRFADRTGYEGVRPLATFVREAQRHGSDLADALRIHADMLRSQRESDAEEAAQKAAVKILIPTLLLILPAVFVVLAGPAAIRVQEAFSK
jgi:tight adherence protein C